MRLRLIPSLIAVLAVTLGTAQGAQATGSLQAPRVIGGSDISIAEAPWQVLFIVNGSTVCSGSFVSPTQIVSAAHCFVGAKASSVQAWAGITKLTERSASSALKISTIANHPGFSFDTYANDIALVTLSKSASPSLGTRTLALPVSQDAATWPAAGTPAAISGWGEIAANDPRASTHLKGALVEILASPDSSVCGDYGSVYLNGMQICAGGGGGTIDACQGDSGSPLIVSVDSRPVMAGIASTGQSCADANFPGLYSRVTTFLPWLASQGVNLAAAGSNSSTAMPGTAADGVPSSFLIGHSYSAADFAGFAKFAKSGSKATVISGRACTQAGKRISFLTTGKCTLLIASGKKSARLVVTIY